MHLCCGLSQIMRKIEAFLNLRPIIELSVTPYRNSTLNFFGSDRHVEKRDPSTPNLARRVCTENKSILKYKHIFFSNSLR